MSAAVDRVIDEAIDTNKIVGAEVVVLRDGAEIYRRAAGYFDREAGIEMPQNAIYRLASVTKPLVAATALAMIDKGLLALTDKVADHLPYFRPKLANGDDAGITIHHLLTHTAGLAYAYPAESGITGGMVDTHASLEDNFSLVAQQPLLFEPGANWSYSVAIDVLGAVLAAVHGTTLGDAVAAYVTGPLGMTETGFFVADKTRLAKPYADSEPMPVPMDSRHVVLNEAGEGVTFSPNRIFNPDAFQSGGAGMAGTSDDLIVFFEAMRMGGRGVVSPDLLAQATRNQIGAVIRDDAGQKFGYLGAVVEDPIAAETPCSPGTYNWGGVYGHSWLVDPAQKLVMLSMSNTALEGCTGPYPRLVRNAIYADFL